MSASQRCGILSVILIQITISQMTAQSTDTLLAVAARDGQVVQVQQLLRAGHNPDASLGSWTPLMLATMNGEIEIARLLIQAGANLHRLHTDYGSALGVAAMSPFTSVEGEIALLRLLLEHGAVVESENGSGMTPLMFAAREGKKGDNLISN